MSIVSSLGMSEVDLERAASRALRYERRLLREAFLKAEREGITIAKYRRFRIVRPNDPTCYIYIDGEGNVDRTNVLELVRADLPSLYRKYEKARNDCERITRSFDQ